MPEERVQFTPGPWEVAGKHCVCVQQRGTPRLVADCGDRTKEGTNEANACLIAAAPELFAACRAAREVLTCVFSLRKDGPGRQAYEKLGAALARAEGREP